MVMRNFSTVFEVRASMSDLVNTLEYEDREKLFLLLHPEFSGGKHDRLNIKYILEAGENQSIEYKETFSYNTKAKKSGDDNIRHALLREVAEFLNTEGGVILIGVSDDQMVTGIECDDFKDPESYIRKIMLVIAAALGETAATLTQLEIHEYDGEKICSVKCVKSTKPIYCEYKNFGEETFVRIGNVTKQPPRKEWMDYCHHHFK